MEADIGGVEHGIAVEKGEAVEGTEGDHHEVREGPPFPALLGNEAEPGGIRFVGGHGPCETGQYKELPYAVAAGQRVNVRGWLSSAAVKTPSSLAMSRSA